MSPLDKIFRSEISDIKESNKYQIVNVDTVAGYVGISRGYLINILRGRRRGDVSIIVRLCCVLGVSPETAEEILHAAGYDISIDWSPSNKEYRAAIASSSLDECNDHLEQTGTYISGRYRR